jgi:hypothetical protein
MTVVQVVVEKRSMDDILGTIILGAYASSVDFVCWLIGIFPLHAIRQAYALELKIHAQGLLDS